MRTKIFIILFILLFLILLIGLAVLMQRRQANATQEEDSEKALEIAGTDEDIVPSKALEIINSAAQSASQQIEQQPQDVGPMAPKSQAPEMSIDKNKKYSAVLETTEGEITIVFTTKQTPITVNNFITLARKDFYDGTIFHRVIEGFMIQGGDPRGDGTGGPGYQFDDEKFSGSYTRGTVAMANAGPNTNGSQFFIMHEDSGLPPNYVIFGQVTEGMDVVDAIATAEVERSRGGENSKPVSPVTVTNVKIVEE